MLRIEDLVNALSPYIDSAAIFEAFSEADESLANYVVLKFRVKGTKYIDGVNVIVRYVPHSGIILWVKLEVLLNRELPAKEFFTRVYGELIKLGAEVVVREDGVSVFYRLRSSDVLQLSKDITNYITKSLNIIEGLNKLNLLFEGFMVLSNG